MVDVKEMHVRVCKSNNSFTMLMGQPPGVVCHVLKVLDNWYAY